MTTAREIVDLLLYRSDTRDFGGGVKAPPLVDIRRFAQLYAGMEAGEFYCRHLYNTPYYGTHIGHLKAQGEMAAGFGPGLFLEFGVATGKTLQAIAQVAGRQVFGFDSFEGLPEDWRDGVKQGAFAMQPPELEPNASLVIGRIETTLPKFLNETTETVRFVHIDTDLYSAAKVILDQCRPRFADKAVIVFDEFFNYPGWRDHEYKAYCEFQEATRDEFQTSFIGVGGGCCVSVLLERLSPRQPRLAQRLRGAARRLRAPFLAR